MVVDPARVDEDGVRVEEPLRGVDLVLQSAGIGAIHLSSFESSLFQIFLYFYCMALTSSVPIFSALIPLG